MIKRITIENYKSIRKLDLELGRLNVFIGENGSGKTNILEAIALGSAAAQDKLSNEFLAPRGIRVTAPEFMHSAFEQPAKHPIEVTFEPMTGREATYRLVCLDTAGMKPVQWVNHNPGGLSDDELREIATRVRWRVEDRNEDHDVPVEMAGLILGALASLSEDNRQAITQLIGAPRVVPEFFVFAPENSILRNVPYEGQILPLGVKGEGLLDHLQALASQPDVRVLDEINDHLSLLDWFESLHVPDKDQAGRALRIRDRYLPEGVAFDQRSANEGFLFLLFYFTLFASPHTPSFFAIDNVDASLNPKMCAALMRSMVALAKKHDKQAIVTTHNPSLLDGLDLHDDEQRLFVVQRRRDGSTRIERIGPPKPLDGDAPVRMSEAFVRGYIGGLPKNF
ncbi:MAG TPA: AAA family ATPase [Kofleriaceae bacterium]|nr:AAA family ATPase [Kofleriaceae bacterium]